MVLPFRMHDVRGERKALWRESGTVPEAGGDIETDKRKEQ